MRKQRGFTLIEVMMALAIISAVLLAMATATASYIHIVSVEDTKTSALQLVDARIEAVQMDPNYAGIDTTYAGTESNFPTMPGYTRRTTIVQVGGAGQSVNYKRVMVTVDGPGLAQPVSRTITVGVP
ncbi:MAG: prepilin-type N-terminal cleavage/methylation domain-containing protein [Gemmatimonadota bacterium]|nr:MAG: prepilin-type N-terminal cleavage/methylation domain-containing protein [Gemmatimonadota bacterium]